MDVKKITSNTNTSNVVEAVQTAKTIAFGGAGGAYTTKEVGKLTETLKEAMPSYITTMDKLRCLKGEAGGIIINSLGTGLVAPIFIAYNPLSNTDEKTKKYTALRQPVSAVLAVLIQAGLTKPLSALYEHLANNGLLGKSPYLDKSILQDKDYFVKQFSKYKNLGIKPGKLAEQKVAEQTAAVIKMLEEEGAIRFSKNKVLKDKDVLDLVNKTIDTYKTDIQSEIVALGKKDIKTKVERAQLLINPKHKEAITEMCNKITTMKNKDKLAKILEPWLKSKDADIKKLATEFLERENVPAAQHRASKTLEKLHLFNRRVLHCEEMGKNSAFLTEKLEAIANASNEDVGKIANEVRAKFKGNKNAELIFKMFSELELKVDAKDRKAYVEMLTDGIKQIEAAKGDRNKLIEIFQNSYYKHKASHLDTNLKILDGLKVNIETNKLAPKEIIHTLKSKIASFNERNFTADMVSKWKTIVAGRFKGFTQITNILVGLCITLPITCSALNWIYPRFMDIFFPHLAKNDSCAAPEENKAKKSGGAK